MTCLHHRPLGKVLKRSFLASVGSVFRWSKHFFGYQHPSRYLGPKKYAMMEENVKTPRSMATSCHFCFGWETGRRFPSWNIAYITGTMLVLWLCNQECKHHDLCILKGSLWFPQKKPFHDWGSPRGRNGPSLHKHLIQLLLSWFISMQAFDRNWPFKSPVRRNDPMTDFSRRPYTLDMGFVSRQIDSTSWNGRVSDWRWHVYQIHVCSVVIFPTFVHDRTWPRAPRAPVNWFSPSGAGSGPATGLAAASQPKLWSIEQKFCIFQRSVYESTTGNGQKQKKQKIPSIFPGTCVWFGGIELFLQQGATSARDLLWGV